MKERPVLFSSPMVRAILDGRKTQTRRIVAPGNSTVNGRIPNAKHDAREWFDGWINLGFDDERVFADGKSSGPSVAAGICLGSGRYLHVPVLNEDGQRSYRVRCRWEPGMRLWVRENFRVHKNYDEQPPSELLNEPEMASLHYEADCPAYDHHGRLRPGMFMPRQFSRITLQITDVRVERIQEISENDAKAEGVRGYVEDGCWVYEDYINGRGTWCMSAKGSFLTLWESLNGYDSWERSVWCWVVSFKRVELGGGR